MARELTGSGQARRAGLWDEVRPEALVPRERDPVTGSLSRSVDPDGSTKDRPTESSRPVASRPVTVGTPAGRGRWPVAAAAGAVALVLGVGGAVALANRGSDDPRPGATGAGAGTGATGSGGPAVPTSGSVGAPAQEDRSYTGTMTTTGEAEPFTSALTVGVSCTETECRLLGWSMSGRPMTWAPGATAVSGTLPKVGELTNICEGAEPYAAEQAWAMTITDDALSFTVTGDEETAACPGGGSAGVAAQVIEFEGTRDR